MRLVLLVVHEVMKILHVLVRILFAFNKRVVYYPLFFFRSNQSWGLQVEGDLCF